MTKPCIMLDGLISSGKSSIATYLQDCGLVDYVDEPHALWRSFCGLDLLTHFYEPDADSSFLFQLTALCTQTSLCHSGSVDRPKIVERPILSCLPFIHANREKLGGRRSEILRSVYDELANFTRSKIGAVFYIDTPVEICLQRLRRRGHKYEQGITLEYLEKLRLEQQNMLTTLNIPVVVFRNTGSIEECLDSFSDVLQILDRKTTETTNVHSF